MVELKRMFQVKYVPNFNQVSELIKFSGTVQLL